MKNENYADSVAALQAWINEAQHVLGYYNPDLWLFARRENKMTAEDIALKAKANLGRTCFIFLTDRGLTLNFRLDKEGNLTAWIGGWGRNEVPETFLVMTMILKTHGLLPVKDFEGTKEPLTDEWLENYWESFESSMQRWVRKNIELLPSNVGKINWS